MELGASSRVLSCSEVNLFSPVSTTRRRNYHNPINAASFNIHLFHQQQFSNASIILSKSFLRREYTQKRVRSLYLLFQLFKVEILVFVRYFMSQKNFLNEVYFFLGEELGEVSIVLDVGFVHFKLFSVIFL